MQTGSLAFADPRKPRQAADPVIVTPKPAAAAADLKTPGGAAAASPARERAPFPDPASGAAEEIWGEFFASHQPRPSDVRREILKLHNQGQHQQVIAALEAALINGQSQPWMYEVLALSMEIEKYPREEVERVVLSMTDFSGADFSSTMYSAAYLVRFGRTESALGLFRQASRISPENGEPYILSLEHAVKLGKPEEITWAACGILLYDWSRDHAARHRNAEDTLAALERQLTRQKDETRLEELRKARSEARQRDVRVELAWSGKADLDLQVEDPFGGVCSFKEPLTAAGGVHLNDGFGPKPEDCKEVYVCALAPSGEFRVRVNHVWGQLVGKRATLTITTHQGSPDEKVERRTLLLDQGDATAVFTLEGGRRTQPRPLGFADPGRLDPQRPRPLRQPIRDPNVQRARAEFQQSRGFPLGFVGVQPIVNVIPEGVTMGATAIVSPDRRYVRLGISPVFTNITDVFTYTFFGGGNANQGGNRPGQGGANR